MRCLATVYTPECTGLQLAPGAEYGLYVLPHDTTKAVVVDAKTRGVIGTLTSSLTSR